MRSIFFQTAESSAGAGTQPAGCGGESNEFEVLTKASKDYALILPNPILIIYSAIYKIVRCLNWLAKLVSLHLPAAGKCHCMPIQIPTFRDSENYSPKTSECPITNCCVAFKLKINSIMSCRFRLPKLL
ncbi:MAG: hypothetical protein ABIN36_08550 [Ferruginibacter sp.]